VEANIRIATKGIKLVNRLDEPVQTIHHRHPVFTLFPRQGLSRTGRSKKTAVFFSRDFERSAKYDHKPQAIQQQWI
jgi:hypothetical protein